MRCVAKVGYSQATIRGIAKAADMTSGSLYHHFPNKSELLKATVKEIDEIALPRLRAAAARADGDVVERLEAVLDESDRLMREYPHLAAFDRAMRAESTAHRRAGRPRYPGLKALRDIINDIIEDARARGALPPDTNPGAAVNAIYALTRGLTEQAASLTSEGYAAALARQRDTDQHEILEQELARQRRQHRDAAGVARDHAGGGEQEAQCPHEQHHCQSAAGRRCAWPHRPQRDEKRGNDFHRAETACDRGDAEYVIDPAHQWAVFDEHAGFHLHVLAEPDPGQHDDQAVTADQLSG